MRQNDNLDDLLKKFFEKKEIPTADYRQSVLEKLNGSGKEKRSPQMYIWKAAAVCLLLVSLTAVGISMYFQGGHNKKDNVSQMTEHHNREKNRKEDLAMDRDEKKARKPLPSVQPSDARADVTVPKQQETSTVKKKNDKPAKTPGGVSTKAPGNKATDAPTEKDREVPGTISTEMPSSVPTQIPETTTTDKPGDSGVPSGDIPIALCSLTDYTIAEKKDNDFPVEGTESSEGRDELLVDAGKLCSEYFGDQIITSYSQMQQLIQNLQQVEGIEYDIRTNNLISKLERYDEGYFRNKSLCIGTVYESYGYHFELSSVEGKGETGILNVQVRGKWPEDTCAPCINAYYVLFLELPSIQDMEYTNVNFQVESLTHEVKPLERSIPVTSCSFSVYSISEGNKFVEMYLPAQLMISSYEQMQQLMERMQQMDEKDLDSKTVQLISKLGNYDENYFKGKILCIASINREENCCFELWSLGTKTGQEYAGMLSIQLKGIRKVPDDLTSPPDWCYHVCLVEIPSEEVEEYTEINVEAFFQ